MSTWSIEGELILNCNCTVFCPCVISLGKHPPTEGYCQAWAGVRIDKGVHDGVDLSGLTNIQASAMTWDFFKRLAIPPR